MSFCSDAKLEILETRSRQRTLKKALAHGLFLFARSFGDQQILLRSELPEIPALAARLLSGRDFLGKQAILRQSDSISAKRAVYSLALPNPADRHALLALFGGNADRIARELLTTPEECAAFLAGMFLSCGNVSDPERSYHLEFAVRSSMLCKDLLALLTEVIPGARATTRRTKPLIYYKECVQIEDFLTLSGASKASLAMIDVEMLKTVRNHANRATNCETANIDKQVEAAAVQLRAIQKLAATPGLLQTLPEPLQLMAALRLQHPDASLRELAELAGTSRSGAHRRLAALVQLSISPDK